MDKPQPGDALKAMMQQRDDAFRRIDFVIHELSELSALETECSTAKWVRTHCLAILRGQVTLDGDVDHEWASPAVKQRVADLEQWCDIWRQNADRPLDARRSQKPGAGEGLQPALCVRCGKEVNEDGTTFVLAHQPDAT